MVIIYETQKFNFFGLNTSWLGLLNRILLQWFFIRLQASIDVYPEITGFQLIGFIIPTTGWSTGYKYVGKEFEKTVWKQK